MQKQSYKIAKRPDSRKNAEFLSRDGQLLLPFLELVCNTEQAADELIDVAGMAAGSLLEGLGEMFTINALGLSKTLRRAQAATNVIELLNSGVRSRTRRVKRWREHGMAVRWVAASLMDVQQRFKRIIGYKQLWILDARLKEPAEDDVVAAESEAA